MTIDKKTDEAIARANVTEKLDIFEAVVYAAAEFWEECPDDFCIQQVNPVNGTVIFGSTNRVVWDLKRGFWVDGNYCTEAFNHHSAAVFRRWGFD